MKQTDKMMNNVSGKTANMMPINNLMAMVMTDDDDVVGAYHDDDGDAAEGDADGHSDAGSDDYEMAEGDDEASHDNDDGQALPG